MCKEPTTIRRITRLRRKFGGKDTTIFWIMQGKCVFLCVWGHFFEIFVHKKNATQQDGVEWIKRIVNYWGMLKFIRIEEDGDGAIVDEVHFFSGIRMQTGEEVVHSKISEQDEEEGDNTEDMVDDWW